MSTEEGRNLT